MKKFAVLLLILILSGCVNRTTKVYSHTPAGNPHGVLISESEEIIWIWNNDFFLD